MSKGIHVYTVERTGGACKKGERACINVQGASLEEALEIAAQVAAGKAA